MTGRSVVLIGFSGSGKSAVGALLARRLGMDLRDTDAMVEARSGRTVDAIFQKDGEAVFRALEAEAVRDAVAGAPAVIACGGGTIVAVRNYTALRDAGVIVYLRTSAQTITQRLGDAAGRPLLAGRATAAVPALLAERALAYKSAADLIVDTDGKSPADVAAEIEELLKDAL